MKLITCIIILFFTTTCFGSNANSNKEDAVDKLDWGKFMLTSESNRVSFIKYINKKELKFKNNEFLIQKLYYRVGIHSYDRNDLKTAYTYFYKLEQLFKKKILLSKAQIITFKEHYANTLLGFNQNKSSININKELLEDPELQWEKRCKILNSIGLSYEKENSLNKSEYYFGLALKEAIKNNQKDWIGVIRGNLAKIYMINKKYELGEKSYLFDFNNSIEYKEWNSAILSANSLILFYEKMHQTQKIIPLLKLVSLIPENDEIRNSHSFLWLYSRKLEYEGNKIEALKLLKKSYLKRDSVMNIQSLMQFKNNIFHQEFQKKNLELKLVQSKIQSEKQSKYYLNILFALVLIIVGLIFYGVYRKYKSEKKLLLFKNSIYEKNLLYYRGKLNDVIDSLIEKSTIIEVLNKQINELLESKSNLKSEDLVQLKENVNSLNLIKEEDLIRFEELYSNAFPDFWKKLKSICPTITPSELRYAALLKLELPRQKLETILGVSYHAIRKTDLRLRKKLQIEGSSGNLMDFLSQIY